MEKKLSMSKSAIRARHRREVSREQERYNNTLKEFVEYKYSHIIDEFDSFYNELQQKYPKRRVYVNTNEFRLWRKQQIKKSFAADGVQIKHFDSIDLHGKGENDSDEFTDDDEQGQPGSDEQGQPGSDEQGQPGSDEQGQPGSDEQGQPGSDKQGQPGSDEQGQPGSDEQGQPGSDEQGPNGNNNIINAAMEHADNEIADIIAEIENGGVSLNEDEGIDLDLMEELQADIEDFDYRLEVEMDDIIW